MQEETTRSPVTEMPKPSKEKKSIKAVSLIVLTLQNATLAISIRHSRTQKGIKFVASTAVVMTELVKFITSLFLVYYYESFSVSHFLHLVYTTIIKHPLDTLKVSVVCITYTIQNNLIYLAADHLDAATLQVTYQLKILTTAVFAVLLLRRSLSYQQWFSLLILLGGVALVQLSEATDAGSANKGNQNRLIGMIEALAACVLSGFGGVFFEKMLKGADVSIWMRNVQLSGLSIPVGLVQSFVSDRSKIFEQGFFGGYNFFVIYLILLQAFGGLLVAVVIKYADNILKGFATSLAIIISSILSIYLFGFMINVKFVVGAIMVIASVFLYNVPLQQPTKPRIYQAASTNSDKMEV